MLMRSGTTIHVRCVTGAHVKARDRDGSCQPPPARIRTVLLDKALLLVDRDSDLTTGFRLRQVATDSMQHS
jgi:hypothetical protein